MQLRGSFFVILAAFLGALRPAAAQLANQPPAPQWLAAEAEPVVVEKRFAHQGKLLRAILFIACDSETEALLNGRSAGRVQPRAQAASLDVTALVRDGDNHLQLKAASGRIAALLELNGDMANKTWLATEDSWKREGGGVLKPTAIESAANPFDFSKTFDAYNSWQLAKPGAQSLATDAGSVTVPAGFKVELLRSASGEEGSWVAMAFDPQGRITLAREKRGLLRFDPKTGGMEVIEDTLLECRGLLYAHGFLYANANNSKGLYRLRDVDGDGRYEEAVELVHTEGGVGHGRNHIKMGPDGRIWVAHGNNVLLPKMPSSSWELHNFADDQLLPNPWNGTMFDGNVELPAGHVLRVDGSEVQLVAGGFRNPLDGAFNHEGEYFVFDADMERDVGTSWYMPTRVLHVVPGADYGWRRGTGRYPAWYVDTLPSVVDIGLSSPTGVFFGYGAKFPPKYQEALFILDWAYGRVIAVALESKGASYSGTQETFISGRPLNVTDGCIGPDGAMWFITGGRGTQSGLYRVHWTGGDIAVAPVAGRGLTPEQKLRRVLETGMASNTDLRKGLASDDPFLRHAAVKMMESRVGFMGVEEVQHDSQGWGALSRWLVAVRSGREDLRDAAMRAVLKMPWPASTPEQQLAALRILGIGMARAGTISPEFGAECLSVFESRFPHGEARLDRELCALLIRLKSPVVIAKASALLKAATSSEDLVYYPLQLRYLNEGWTLEQRRIVFDALNRAEKMNGASTYFKAIADTRSELAAALTADEAKQLASVIYPAKPVQLAPHALPGHTFKQWKLADLEPMLDKVSKGRNYEKAKAGLIAAQCVFCHRVSNDPSLPAGVFGPDLTQVSARFGRRDLLMHILEPSLIIDDKFRSTAVTKVDGEQVTGFLEREEDERVVLKPNPLAPDVVEIGKSQIRSRKLSDVSPMPPGLLNAMKADQILDMLAWFETGGDPAKAAWVK